jgi:CDP-diacylglycerol pyrophosphatase
VSDSAGTRTRMTRVAALAALSVLAFALAAADGAAVFDRGALWRVVQTCVTNHELTGAAFPCIEVNLSGGEDRGYVILRPPFGKPDNHFVADETDCW